MASVAGPRIDVEALQDRYGLAIPEPLPDTADAFEKASLLHEQDRRLLLVDKHRVMIARLLRKGFVLAQRLINPGDHRESYLAMETIAAEVNRLGADELIVSGEVWEADVVAKGDPRTVVRASEWDDRRESFLTYAIQRSGRAEGWRSVITRMDDDIQLGDVESLEEGIPPLVRPVIEAWAEWTRDQAG